MLRSMVRKVFEEKFTAARMAKDYLKIYESLADPLTHKTNAHNIQEHPDHLNRKIWKQHAINQ